MKGMKILTFIAILIIFLPFVLSEDGVKLELANAITNVEAGDKAVYTLRLTNEKDIRDTFIINTEVSALLFSDVLDDITIFPGQLKLDPGQSKTLNVTVSTLETARSNTVFDFKINIISIDNPIDEHSYNLSGFVIASKDIVQIIPELPDKIAPNEDLILKVKFKNKINSILRDYKLLVSSEVNDLNKESDITLMPMEERMEEFLFRLGNIKPGDYGVSIGLYEGDNLRGSFLGAFTVIEKPLAEEKKDEIKSFLKNKLVITKKNVGNVMSRQRIEMKLSSFSKLFTAYRPEPNIEDSKLVWEFTLNPGDEYDVEVVTNYRSILYGLLVIIIFILALLLHIDRSVVIKKRIFRIKESADGISELKILLHMKNGSGSVLENTRIIDLIPNIIEPTQEYGTLKPTTVQKGMHSIRLIWDIGKIEPREERVITYKVKAKLKLAGEIILPAAAVHYMKGIKLVTVKSARLQLKPKVNIEGT